MFRLSSMVLGLGKQMLRMNSVPICRPTSNFIQNSVDVTQIKRGLLCGGHNGWSYTPQSLIAQRYNT